jgi:hypothetical protein
MNEGHLLLKPTAISDVLSKFVVVVSEQVAHRQHEANR